MMDIGSIIAYDDRIMSRPQAFGNRVKALRAAQGWSQAELAQRAGISRAGVSAIEADRLVPSVAAALALARVLQSSVEEIFGGQKALGGASFPWAWEPGAPNCRFWAAEVAGQGWRFPAESDVLILHAHDGVASPGTVLPGPFAASERTLVIATCDPAARWLAQEYERQTGFRMLVLGRSSQQALELVNQGQAHAAGIHWADARDPHGNAGAMAKRGMLDDFMLLHVADWEDGLALRRDSGIRSARQAVKSRSRWIGRMPGAGARRCQDHLLGDRKAPSKVARDHRGVVEAIRAGWADVGVCVRLASEEGRLDFITVSTESYDVCYRASLADDPRLRALQTVVRSAAYRAMLADLPGYDPRRAGELQPIAASDSSG